MYILVLKITLVIVCILSQVNSQLEEWKIPCGAIYKPDGCENASIDTLRNVEEYELCAPALLDTVTREYVWGGAGSEKTLFENKEAYKRIWIKKQVLRGLTNYSMETYVFGRKVGIPIGISPTVGHSFYHPEGERGTARGAASAGAVMVLDVISYTTLEDVAAIVPPGAEIWMQTYLFANFKLVTDLVRRAERAGFKAIVVTVDQLDNYDIRCDAIKAFSASGKYDKTLPNIDRNLKDNIFRRMSVSFKDISWLAGITNLPIVVKGIQSGEEAIRAIEAGASAIFVSNHGGRQFDDALPTIDSLPEVVGAVKARYPWVDVFVDGGVRSGHDVFKALARGAKMAFIGRPAIWGLTMGGARGVSKVLSILRDEFEDAMIRAGISDPSLISPSSIVSQWIYSDYP